MTESKYLLVRSPNLIKESQIGYGWGSVNFSDFDNFKDLMVKGFAEKDIGRQTNQIKRFFNLKKGDYVIVPFSGSFAIAEVIGKKSHYPVIEGIPYGENRISVRYLKHENGYFIPRSSLSTALQNRMKIRMTVCDLSEFSEELNKHVEQIKSGKLYTWNIDQELRLKKRAEDFKTEMLKRLRNNKDINLKSGGLGLEYLVEDILESKGYNVHIPAKNERSGVEDVDVVATRMSEFSDKKEVLLIQVKHHTGTSSTHGINQLTAYDLENEEYSNIEKVLLTTADFKDKETAESKNVTVLAGMDFVDWLYDNLENISEKNLSALGISTMPTLL